jgi:hypothetical protein
VERSQPGGRSSTRLVALVVVATGVLLMALVLLTQEEGPNRTVTGPATTAEPHRLCVGDASPVCVEVHAPERVAGLAVGDCVRMRYSAQAILVSVRRLDPADCR